jgi:hypothetical protein
VSTERPAAELLCLEAWPTFCALPATHVVGLGLGPYLACDPCAQAWAPERRIRLTERDRALVLLGVSLERDGAIGMAEADRGGPNPERDRNHGWQAAGCPEEGWS